MHFRRFQVSLMLLTALLATPFGSLARAQQPTNDVAVISVSPVDSLLKDTSYLLRATNFPEMGGLVSIMANQYTQGLDRSKPIGAIVTLDAGMPNALLFLPMNNRELFFGSLAGMGIEPDDLGEGLFEVATPGGQVFYAKDTDGWMYIAQTENAFGALPEDPSALLGKLPEQYEIAIRINVAEIPDAFKEQALQQIRIGYEQSLAVQQGQTDEEKAAAKEMGEASIAQLQQLMNETDQLIFGWNVSSDEQRTYIDTGVRFVEGSSLAQQIAESSDATTLYDDFELPGASAKFRFTSEIADSDKELTKNSLRNSMSQIETQLEQADLPPEAKEVILELVQGLLDITEKTIDEGKFDGAGSLSVADDTLRFMIGGQIADGQALADQFKETASKLPDDPKVPTFLFDYETYKGVTLHKVTASLADADAVAKRVFGDEIVITIGTGEKDYIVALDPSGDASVKATIDRMIDKAGVKASPFESVIALEGILRFAQTVSPNSILDGVVNTISQYAGKDKVQITSNLIDRGALYRISVDEGVLQSIGAAAKSGQGGGQGF